MQKGYAPHIIISRSGQIIGIATGSDACTEHECGSRDLQEALTAHTSRTDNEIILRLRESAVLRVVKGFLGEKIEFPALLDRKRIRRNLDKIQFSEKQGTEPEALLGFSARAGVDISTRYIGELDFFRDEDCAGAWNERSFAFRVRGKKNVNLLKDFYEQMKKGNTCFAGSFAEKDGNKYLSGLVIMVVDRLRQEYLQKIEEAQQNYENNLRLKAVSRAEELFCLMRKHVPGRHIGHFSPRWGRAGQDEVMYHFNPAHRVPADFGGPYSYKELAEWLESKCSYHLSPHKEPHDSSN